VTRVLILAAGSGKRLRPLTKNKPKILVSLFGKSILQRQLELFKSCKIKDIAIVSGYKSNLLKKFKIINFQNKNYDNTNMVTSLFSAMSFLKKKTSEDLIITYGDIIYEKKNLLKVMNEKNDICIMIDKHWLNYWKLRFKNPLSDAESLILDSKNFIKEVGKKTNDYKNINGQYTGLIKVKGKMINKLIKFYKKLDKKKFYDGKNFQNMYLTSFIQLLIKDNIKIKAVLVKNGWLEVDSIQDLNLYKRLYSKNKLDKFCKLL
jgi:choline kinase